MKFILNCVILLKKNYISVLTQMTSQAQFYFIYDPLPRSILQAEILFMRLYVTALEMKV